MYEQSNLKNQIPTNIFKSTSSPCSIYNFQTFKSTSPPCKKYKYSIPRKKSTVLRSNLMRLYFPVDLTGNLIMIEKLVLGGIWTGDFSIFTPDKQTFAPSWQADCSAQYPLQLWIDQSTMLCILVYIESSARHTIILGEAGSNNRGEEETAEYEQLTWKSTNRKIQSMNRWIVRCIVQRVGGVMWPTK